MLLRVNPMRFDWYQPTIEDKPAHVIDQLLKLGHEIRRADGLAKAYRYQQGWEIHHNDRGVVARVFAGGNGLYPHAIASSDETGPFVDLVRNEWPDRHLVTRLDSAQDFYAPGSYEKLRRVARKVAKTRRMCFQEVKDELNPQSGRTQYIGSKKSAYFGRLYEKGFEMQSKVIGLLPGMKLTSITNTATGEQVKPDDWTRLESQARPQGEEARRLAAIATPEQVWTFTEWSHELAKEAMALELERLYIRTRKTSKDDEALRWMCRQYGPMLGRLQNDVGDWDCVGREIGRIIKQQQDGFPLPGSTS
jgi:hypothetical protein